MSEKWFSNRGQAAGLVVAIAVLIVALVANWNAIRSLQYLLVWWPVIIMPTTALIAFRLGRSYQSTELPKERATSKPDKSEPNSSLPSPSHNERFELDDDRLTFAKQAVKLGDFWEVGNDLSRMKIVPLSFKPLGKDVNGVEIRFDTQGSLFYGGTETKETGTNRLVLSESKSGFQAEPRCAYQFSFSNEHMQLKAVRVDHINELAKEVVIEVCFLRAWKRSRATV
jgi:hypothetical protein